MACCCQAMIFIEIIDRSLCGGASRLFRRGKTITVIWILGLTLILTVALVLNLAVLDSADPKH